jgi:hypothetical protein
MSKFVFKIIDFQRPRKACDRESGWVYVNSFLIGNKISRGTPMSIFPESFEVLLAYVYFWTTFLQLGIYAAR